MKIPLKNIKSHFNEQQELVVKDFVKFLQKELPLKKDVKLIFTAERPHGMTTGLRMTGNIIYILSKNRLIADILRTISHEWMHEYQHQSLGLDEKEKTQNIGGPDENLANIVSGIIFKKFEKNNEKYKKIIYSEE